MIKQLANSICTRCGKRRVIIKTFEKKVDGAMITYTITECSDPECQKIVGQGLKREEEKRKSIKEEQVKREEARKVLQAEKKAEKK